MTIHEVAQTGDHAEVVGDHHHCGAEVVHQLLQQLQHLRLDRDVEGGCRFVADQQAGLQASAMAINARWRMPPDSWWGTRAAGGQGQESRTA